LWLGSGWVSHLWFGFSLENFPLKCQIFQFLPFGSKNLYRLGRKVPGLKAGQPLIYCGAKVSSGRVRAHLKPVSYLWLAFGFGKFPLEMSNFSLRVGSKITRVRGGSASYLLRVKSMLESGPISSIISILLGQFGLEDIPGYLLGLEAKYQQPLGLRNFHYKSQNYHLFSLWVKKILAGRVKKYPGLRQVGLLFTVGQKYHGPSLGNLLYDFHKFLLNKIGWTSRCHS